MKVNGWSLNLCGDLPQWSPPPSSSGLHTSTAASLHDLNIPWPLVSPTRTVEGGHDFRLPVFYFTVPNGEQPSHLLWKLGLWIICEINPNDSTGSTACSARSTVTAGWRETWFPTCSVCSSVLILGRNCASDGMSWSRPISLCRWLPRLSKAPCLADV